MKPFQVIQLSAAGHCFRSVLIKWPGTNGAGKLITELEYPLSHHKATQDINNHQGLSFVCKPGKKTGCSGSAGP
jgi:formyltetrahydrofolate hydrolase